MSSQNQFQPLCDVNIFIKRLGLGLICSVHRSVNWNLAMDLSRSVERGVQTKPLPSATSVLFHTLSLYNLKISCATKQNCFTKPKYPPYDFCGKKCGASAASKLNVPMATLPVQTIPAASAPLPTANNRTGGHAKAPPPKPHVPQIPPAPTFPAARDRRADPSKTVTVAQPPANTPSTILQNVKQAFTSNSQQQQPQPQKSEPHSQSTTKNRSSQAPATTPPALNCLIPGCGKPVHVDENGFPASAYCSQRHRE